jgi:hypothetical protein
MQSGKIRSETVEADDAGRPTAHQSLTHAAR